MRLGRARKQLEELETATDRFVHGHDSSAPGGVDIEFDPNAGRFIAEAHVPAAFPEELGGNAGEILYHLRSALDNLVWQLVIANGKTPGSSNEFPIYKSESEFTRRAGKQLRGVSTAARTAIEGLQPFIEAPENPGYTTLCLIHDLNRIDKHRLPHMACMWLCHVNATFNAPSAGGPVKCTHVAPVGPLQDKAKLVEFRFNPDQMRPFNDAEQVYVDVSVSSDIAIQNPEMTFLPQVKRSEDGLPLRPFFKAALSYVEDTVLPPVAAEFA